MTAENSSVRPRQHELETMSKRAFEQALPAVWVARDLPADYGIDYEVEVFEEGGARTGLTFKVQLKATDGPSSSLSLKVSDFAYWATLDVPVLIVLFKANSNELLSYWAHSHNPWPWSGDQRTTTVHFTTPLSDQLRFADRDLRRLRAMRESVLRGPISVAVDEPDLAAAGRLRHALRSKIDEWDMARLVVVTNGDDAHATIGRDGACFSVVGPTGVASMTVHGISGDLGERVPDLFAAMSVLLLKLGGDQIAADVLIRARGETSNGVVEGLAVPLATVLAAAHKWTELAAFFSSAPSPLSADDTLSVIVMASSVMDSDAARMFVHFVRESAEELHEAGQDELAGRWLYMAVFICVPHHLWSEADVLCTRVAELTDALDNHAGFFELAGKAKWNTDDQTAALVYYQRAWELGWRSEQAIAALGEALFVNGHYGQARDHFTAADPAEMTRWAVLLQCVVEGVIELVGVEQQTRVPLTEVDAPEVDAITDADGLLDLLRTRDAINFVLQHRYSQASGNVTLGSIVCYAIQAEDLGRWMLAIVAAAMTDADEQVIRAIVEAASLEFPDVVEVLRSEEHELPESLPDGFLGRAATYAANAAPYEGPRGVQFSVGEVLSYAYVPIPLWTPVGPDDPSD